MREWRERERERRMYTEMDEIMHKKTDRRMYSFTCRRIGGKRDRLTDKQVGLLIKR